MLTRDDLRREHLELDALALDLMACVEQPQPDLETLARLKWTMSRKLAAHLIKEDRLLYPRMEASSNLRVAGLARRFAREMGGLADAFRAYMADWPQERVQRAWPDFGRETMAIMTDLRTRIERKENELYPLLANARDATGT